MWWRYFPMVVILVAIVIFLGGAFGYSPSQYSHASSYSGGGYGGHSGGYFTCGSLKVTEVLDQIYCHHGYYTRFTSTDLAAIKVVLYELGLVTKYAHIQAALDYVEQAIYILKDLRDETYKSYDTSELSKFYQNDDIGFSDLKSFLANETTNLQEHEDIRRGYRKLYGMMEWGTFTPDAFASESEYTSEKYKRGTSLLSLSPAKSSARRKRVSESKYDYAGDYTCGYISSSYCAANSLVLKNVLYRVLKVVQSLDNALVTLYSYSSSNFDACEEGDDQEKSALAVTADTFGSVLDSASVLLEAANYEYELFSGMAASSGYSSNVHGRASGASRSSSSVYQGFPYSYAMQNPYRYRRAPLTVPANTV